MMLHSTGQTRWLQNLIIAQVVADLLFMAAFLLDTRNVSGSWSLIGNARALVSWAVLVLFVLWIYSVHRDLEAIYPDYPLPPHRILPMALIPVYNIWGLWEITAVATNRRLASVPRLPEIRTVVKALYWLAGVRFVMPFFTRKLVWLFYPWLQGPVLVIAGLALASHLCALLLVITVRESLAQAAAPEAA